MEGGGPLQLISVQIIFDIQGESCSCSSREFNLFQYFDVSVLMSLHCSVT